MSMLTIFSICALLPLIYIGRRLLINRSHVTLFDILIAAFSIYFGLFPWIATENTLSELGINPNSDTIVRLYLVYFSFILMLYIIDRAIKRYFPGSVINITQCIEELPVYKFRRTDVAIWLGILIFSWYILLPRAHILTGMIDNSETYADTSLYMLTVSIFNISGCYLFLAANTIVDLKKKRYLDILALLFLFSSFIIGSGRRYFVGMVMLYLLIYYAKNRYTIRWRRQAVYMVALVIVLYVCSLFFNVIRYTKENVAFDEGIIKSLTETIELSVHGYDELSTIAIEANKSRSLGLFLAVYEYLECYHRSYNGYLFTVSFSYAMPRIIYPNKSDVASQGILEQEMGLFHDIADSVLLAGIGDWSYGGGVMGAVFYGLLLLALNGLHVFFGRLGKLPLWLTAYCLYTGFHIVFHTEITLEGIMAMVIQYGLIMIMLRIILSFKRYLYAD